MSRFLKSQYSSLEVYTPGEQPRDKQYIKLNTNESPFPPSDAVVKAVSADEVRDLRLYSDPECKALKTALAELYEVTPQNIYLSNGSDDILNFSFMAFSEKGVIFPEISYGFYKVFAELHNVQYTSIPLKEDFSIDINDYNANGKLIVIANPNAPTGLILSVTQIEAILKANPDSVVLIDEAYIDFGGESSYKLTKKYKNLLTVGTFSKSRSMAGARLGFAIADQELIADLERIKYSTNPYNINRLTLIAGTAAINDNGYYMDNCKKIIENREYTTTELKKLGFFVLPSKANFVFAKSDKIGGEELYLKLKANGILVRHFNNEKIKDFNRITIGSKSEMEKFIEVTAKILEGKL
ncbi:MAG: histidinol-phosphate transaminase [Clostridia bacterium]|nr:histidinol-phosphate transaminase [Clostridia bacterium]